ncbi:hypothetical protein Salat_1885800 [Sesamum alatum]|uniref:Uncharacterized protein n=1 Tax=Sesamum alatum TaxID=300844 RepID=A0AAE2CI62_9LAMI|nr:hypothetical protein Salat_1885800 [Sesamum alatum]
MSRIPVIVYWTSPNPSAQQLPQHHTSRATTFKECWFAWTSSYYPKYPVGGDTVGFSGFAVDVPFFRLEHKDAAASGVQLASGGVQDSSTIWRIEVDMLTFVMRV